MINNNLFHEYDYTKYECSLFCSFRIIIKNHVDGSGPEKCEWKDTELWVWDPLATNDNESTRNEPIQTKSSFVGKCQYVCCWHFHHIYTFTLLSFHNAHLITTRNKIVFVAFIEIISYLIINMYKQFFYWYLVSNFFLRLHCTIST